MRLHCNTSTQSERDWSRDRHTLCPGEFLSAVIININSLLPTTTTRLGLQCDKNEQIDWELNVSPKVDMAGWGAASMAFRIELSLVASTSVVRATKVVKLSSSSLLFFFPRNFVVGGGCWCSSPCALWVVLSASLFDVTAALWQLGFSIVYVFESSKL